MALRTEARPGRGLIAHFARHGTLSNLLMVVMIVAGLVAVDRIRAQYFPDVVVAEVQVSVGWPGAGAEDVDRAIVQVLEPALLAVEGVSDVTSYATEASADITLSFDPGTDLARATADVQAVIDAQRTLPEAADDPEVRRSAWRDRVTDVVITGPVGVDQLARFADEFTARLFAAGITRTSIEGLAAPETMVEVSGARLMQHDVTMAQIAQAIATGIDARPAGEIGGTARVRTGEARRTPAEIAAIVLRTEPDGSALTVGDVATVRVGAADRGRAFHVGDRPAMTVRIDRDADGDAVRMQAEVQAVADAMRPTLPDGVAIDLIRTRAEQITDRIDLLLANGVQGLVLVVVLLFLFLNARTAFWVATGIPVSMLAAVGVMYATGITLNMISMFALIMTLGIVVDDAIVVAEHAEFRARVLREPPVVAAERAATRMALPVLASTMTTMIAFAGLLVLGGRFGDIVNDIPKTVLIVLVVSMVESFLIMPHHMAQALRNIDAKSWYDWPSRTVMRGFGWVQARIVRPGMRVVLRARYPIVAGAILLLALQAAAFLRGDVRFQFFSGPEQSSVTGNFSMLSGASRGDAEAMMQELQRAVGVVADRYAARDGVPPSTFVLAQVGGGAGFGLASGLTRDPDLLGGIAVELIDRDARDWPSSDFIADVESEVRPHPLLEEISFRGSRYGPGGDSLSVDLYGADATVLKAAAEAVKTSLARFPEVSGLEDTLAYDKEEMVLTLTPQGQALGFTIDAVGSALRDQLGGIEAATYPDGPRSAAIRVELPEAELTADFLDRAMMRSDDGLYVPLSDVVRIDRQPGFSSILRENGLRVVGVTGDLADADADRAAAVRLALDDEILPRVRADFGVETGLSGLAEQEAAFLGDAGTGLMLVLAGIYVCLAWVFSSWTQPLVVMSVIPFGLVGAVWGHAHWGVPMSLFSVVGLIGMIGIIVNDSIVLVSSINEYAERRALRPAIVDAVTDRLRPVMLTTLTTLLGLAPLLYDRSAQAEFLKPTVITLVYGLGFGMVLVLFVVPSIVVIQDDVGRLWRSARRMAGARGRGRIAGRLRRTV